MHTVRRSQVTFPVQPETSSYVHPYFALLSAGSCSASSKMWRDTPRRNDKQDTDRKAQADRSVCEIKIHSDIYILMTGLGLIAVGICGKA